MGKSPGKWIKTVLFGKKHSKSSLSKNSTPDKTAAPRTSAEDSSPVTLDPRQSAYKGAENVELEKGISGNSSAVNRDLEQLQSNFVSVPLNDDETRRQSQAATKAQAVFRGYLARRAFRALKGIIRLQALIRGHLVRRQAVATLHCMQAVVKLQALVRGRRVRLLDNMQVSKKYDMGELKVDIGANSIFGSGKLAANAYVRKVYIAPKQCNPYYPYCFFTEILIYSEKFPTQLLLSMPTAMPLSLQYDLAEPNSAWNWLERWSLSRFWDPPARPRKISNTKPQNKQSGSQNVENEVVKSKRTIRKASIAANGDNSTLASFEKDKPKRNPRKVPSHQPELAQEQPQNELERIKRSLRKVSSSAPLASEKLDMETEKPQKQLNNVSQDKIVISAENRADSDFVADKVDILEAPSKSMTTDNPDGMPNDDYPLIETHSLENGEKMESGRFLNDELSAKEDENGKENQKIRKRRSLPVKQECTENISQNAPSLPSYMMATESAKAKLRAQGSAKFMEEEAEVGYVRRHSLPASTNGKINSLSPRVQKQVHANGKGGSKTNRSMTSSRDDKVLQPGWRR